jgi:secondary thiamine-phosphate synthase enzyme
MFTVSTSRRVEFVDITARLKEEITRSGAGGEICYLFNPHTTAGLTINEGADPDVQADIIAALKKVIPADLPYKHMEGNSQAHIMASLMGCSLTVFMEDGRLALGRWQSIYFCEFDGPRTRKVHWRLV